jgi:hypothetical protein
MIIIYLDVKFYSPHIDNEDTMMIEEHKRLFSTKDK